MGVQNLWVLLAPVGRQIEIESLTHKVLAVDASIWLTQFVKAMRDDEGKMIKNAHLIGTFHRVAKLLFYGIKPVFVFDGDTPEIKKKTTAGRRRRQEHQATNLKQTAQRILINRLKLQREQLKRNGGKAAPAVNPDFVLPEASASSKTKPEADEGGGGNEEAKESAPPIGAAASAIEIDGSSSDEAALNEDGDEELRAAQEKSSVGIGGVQKEAVSVAADGDGDFNEDGADDDLTIDDIVLDTTRIDKIDLQAVFALPPHLQKDMINRIMIDRRQEVRNKFIPLAGKPEAYSHTQISSFLATTALHRRIEAAKKRNREKQTEAMGAGSPQGSKLGPGKRIASRSDRFFVYKKASDGLPLDGDSDEEAKGGGGKRHSASDEEEKAFENEMDVVNEIERFEDEAKQSSMFAGSGGDNYGNNLPLMAGFKKRQYRDEGEGEVGKRALTDFSVASVKEFAIQAERQQARKWAVQEATSAWIAKNATQTKSEPTLAIEQARRKRLKIGDHADKQVVAAKTEAKDEEEEAKSICITFKTDEMEAVDDTFSELFPASMFENVKASAAAQAGDAVEVATGEENEEEVEWEDVSRDTTADAAPAEEEKPREDADSQEVQTVDTIAAAEASTARGDDEDDEEVEWEEVASVEPEGGKPVQSLSTPAESKTEGDDAPVAVKNVEDTDESEGDQDDNDEMYLSLRSELEDAKAEEDLEELRGEALKSALATASNLTQWAAGAVRRALAAHSLQHKQFVESAHPITGKSSPHRGNGASVEEAIELAEEDEEDEEEEKQDAEAKWDESKSEESAVAPQKDTLVLDVDEEKVDIESTPVGDEAELVGEDAQLQITIANSMSEDLDKPRVSRYLQYSVPPQSSPYTLPAAEEMVDVVAIQSEQAELKKLRNRQMRDVEGFNDEMVEDVMELLRLFGVPYLVCPMEAEAQCAALEQLGLVDGIITDDSDIFPFGGKKVYKNIFHNQKFVEAFFAKDIEQELGFSQEEMISLALLLGSDYTDGIRGIGIVNATEVVNAYPGIDGLKEFKRWVQAFDLAEEAQRVAEKKAKKSDEELAEMDARERFQLTHANARRKWELGDQFPNAHVVKAYKQPQVDRSDARFSWSLPDLAALREYTGKIFGWDQQKADSVLLPLLQKTAAAPGRGVQMRIDQFFTTYDDEVRYAKIQSKRLRSAVSSRASKKSVASGSGKPSAASSTKVTATPTKASASAKKKITKKKTTLSALGFGGTK